MTEEAFYVPEGGGFRATELTRGPWSREHQHGGPPSALLARACQRMAAAAGMQVVRFGVELYRPIPIGRLEVRVEVVRSGKKRQLWSAALFGDGELARATALGLRTADLDPDGPPQPGLGIEPPERSAPYAFPFFTAPIGYHTGMEIRVARGTFGVGAMAAWMRMRVPLVSGEAPSPLERVVAAADSGNGVSTALDISRWTFLNPDLTVYLHRLPEGEWVGLDASTTIAANGIGLAEAQLSDARGPIGRSSQSLIVEPRIAQR